MADKQLTSKPQTAVSDLMFELADSQRTFSSNYAEGVSRLRKSIVEQVTTTTAGGLILGALVGTIAGLRRR